MRRCAWCNKSIGRDGAKYDGQHFHHRCWARMQQEISTAYDKVVEKEWVKIKH